MKSSEIEHGSFYTSAKNLGGHDIYRVIDVVSQKERERELASEGRAWFGQPRGVQRVVKVQIVGHISPGYGYRELAPERVVQKWVRPQDIQSEFDLEQYQREREESERRRKAWIEALHARVFDINRRLGDLEELKVGLRGEDDSIASSPHLSLDDLEKLLDRLGR